MEVAHPNQLGAVYEQLLKRSFPPQELADRDSFLNFVTWGEVLVERDGELITAAAVGDYSPNTDLLLLEYLAVLPEYRGKGSGSKLLEAAFAQWCELMHPGAFLAEIERPDGHQGTPEYGDPVRRLKFYHKLGLKALALPYYQPALSPELAPVPDLLLGVLIEDESWVQDHRFVEGERLAALLRERNPEPTDVEGPAWQALLDACAGPIELVDLGDYASVPRSGPIG
ncbi:MAG TPA: GNAT family N-acetyltransferase [Propionicimonas sp.]|mgnify:CR=1 FL=1|nr:GNAT family N-acetyltransferase [Propionicimonas sp.]HQA79040.1 GNAT family N-acetyltransferase [Propionicimonas sp.]